jgi:hypothetical protein
MGTPSCLAAVEILIEKIRSSTTHTTMFTPGLACVGADATSFPMGAANFSRKACAEGLNTSEQ